MDAVYDEVRRLTGADAQEATPSQPAITPVVAQVAEGIRAVALRTPTLPPATHTTCYLVGEAELLVVDPASPYPDQQAALEAIVAAELALGRRLVGIALTHHHGDHIGGAVHLATRFGAPVLAHAETAALLAGWVPVDRHLDDLEVIVLAGGVAVTALFTPGHAAGHLCFEVAVAGSGGGAPAIIAGDMVAGIGTILIDPDEGDMATYLASLRRLHARGQATLLPAHGPAIVDGQGKLEQYVAHRLMREARVLAAVRGRPGASAAALVADAYADTPGVFTLLAERSLLAHLAKLEADGAIGRDGVGWVAR